MSRCWNAKSLMLVAAFMVGIPLASKKCNGFHNSPTSTRATSLSHRQSALGMAEQNHLDDEKKDTQELLTWALSPESDSPLAVAIKPSTIGSGNGLFVTQAIPKNELIMVIPVDKVLSVENAWEDDELGEDFMYLTDMAGSNLATLASFVGKEVCGGFDIIFQTHQLSEEKESKWQPYLDCLLWDDDHVLWWSDEEVDRLLKGSNIYDEVASTRQQLDMAIENVQNLFWNRYLYDNGEDEMQDDNDKEEINAKIADSIRGAFCMLLSRAFEDAEYDCMKLIPVLDMAQHCSEKANIRHETSLTSGNVIVRAKRDLQAGEELFTCYSKTLRPSQFFTVFGFVPNDEGIGARELLERRDPIFFMNA